MTLVYLGGPIKGLSYEGATNWRYEARNKLNQDLIEVLDPMRNKEWLVGVQKFGEPPESDPLTAQKGIVTRDRMDLKRCDMVLFNLRGAEQVSIGTMVEFGWADAFRKPIVTIVGPEDLHWHAFVRELSGFIVGSLGDGLEVVKRVLVS